jgi:hypothetical protein
VKIIFNLVKRRQHEDSDRGEVAQAFGFEGDPSWWPKKKKTSFMKMTKKGDKEKGVGTFFLIVTSFVVYNLLKIGRGGGNLPKCGYVDGSFEFFHF